MSPEADLHIHTLYSDGTFSPREVLERVQKEGISAIAITDHDSVQAIEPAILEGEKLGIEVIPGVELTAEYNNSEVHILGYFIDYQKDWFLKKLKHLREVRKERFLQMVQKLRRFNIFLDPAKIVKENKSTALGRLHLARELKKQGYVSSVKEAFNLYIGEGKPCYVKKERILPQEAIAIIKELNGISVIAHPYTLKDEKILTEVLKQGIEGIEVYHTECSPVDQVKYWQVAYLNNLLVTGGSDCHGMAKGGVLIGKIKIPYAFVERLKKYRDERRKR